MLPPVGGQKLRQVGKDDGFSDVPRGFGLPRGGLIAVMSRVRFYPVRVVSCVAM